MKRIDTWTTSSALNDKQGNKSSYGAGSTDHQFQASSCLNDLDEANRKGLINRGDYLVSAAVGSGWTWAASLIKW